MRAPNPEQFKAINHEGGVLLSAGAGSGKTFVLVNHIAHLIEKKVIELSNFDKQTIVKNLKVYLSRIVLMTFTNKAAGELKLRLFDLIDKKSKQDVREIDWTIAQEALPSLTVSTIHGYCLKLLKQGYFPEVGNNFEIISEYETAKKIDKIVDMWLSENTEKYLDNQNLKDHIEIILTNLNSIKHSFQKIFETPELRIFWEEEASPEKIHTFEETFLEILEVLELKSVLEEKVHLKVDEKQKKNKWYQFYINFESFKQNLDLDSNSVSSVLDFFEENPFPRAPGGKNANEEVKDYLQKIKPLRNLIKDNLEDFKNYKEHSHGHLKKWLEIYYDIFCFVAKRYKDLPGLTFSDLEYYVLKGLQNPENQKRVSENFDYLIVDEFQDTSFVQYEIIKKSINEDFSRLFCVGDEKQAIYGFRGGELGVFRDVKNNVPLNLNLKMNYRSMGKVIDFNNQVFEHLFAKGQEFVGVEKNSVEVVYQDCPLEEKKNAGDVQKIKVNIDKDEDFKTLSQKELNEIEAESIFRLIKDSKAKDKETICILYSKLTPSHFLIKKLISSELGFQAQVKITKNEDPVIYLFKLLLEEYISPSDEYWYTNFMCSKVLDFLNVTISDESYIKSTIESFYKRVNVVGLLESYKLFVSELGLCNSNYDNNLKVISEICSSSHEDIHTVYTQINNLSDKYSIDFHLGEDSSKIIMMTAHASKGLEFEHVILGGIHTNGRRNSDHSVLGTMPGSFRWKLKSAQKTYFKTPNYILEDILTKKKDFSESKRLFYVACTRAEKKLSYIDINYDDNPSLYSKNSWINGLRIFENQSKENLIEETSSRCNLSEFLSATVGEPPFYQMDQLGVSSNDDEVLMGVFPELSVTRLATISQCPRKFYLKNICKFDGEELEEVIYKFSEEDELQKYYDENGLSHFSSSASRGILVHEELSHIVKKNFTTSIDFKEKFEKDLKAVEGIIWAKDYLENLDQKYKFISEEPLKFDFFGHMISGTPDLICLSLDENHPSKIVDFKTGRINSDSQQAYWFQLFCYAKCVQEVYKIPNDNFELELIYIDEQKIERKSESLTSIESYLFSEWKKTSRLDQVNLNHCQKCEFGKLCH